MSLFVSESGPPMTHHLSWYVHENHHLLHKGLARPCECWYARASFHMSTGSAAPQWINYGLNQHSLTVPQWGSPILVCDFTKLSIFILLLGPHNVQEAHMNLYLNVESHHHPASKYSVLSILVHWATAICKQDNLPRELEFLWSPFQQNSYTNRKMCQALHQPHREDNQHWWPSCPLLDQP